MRVLKIQTFFVAFVDAKLAELTSRMYVDASIPKRKFPKYNPCPTSKMYLLQVEGPIIVYPPVYPPYIPVYPPYSTVYHPYTARIPPVYHPYISCILHVASLFQKRPWMEKKVWNLHQITLAFPFKINLIKLIISDRSQTGG